LGLGLSLLGEVWVVVWLELGKVRVRVTVMVVVMVGLRFWVIVKVMLRLWVGT